MSLTLTPKETDLTRELIESGYGWTRPIIPRIAFKDCADASTRVLMLHGLARKGAFEAHQSEMNGTIFVPADDAFDYVRRLREAEQAARDAELDRQAAKLLLIALFDHGHQLRCIRSDGWRAGVRTLDRYNTDATRYSEFPPGRHVAFGNYDSASREGALYWIREFAPLRLWQVV